MITNDPEYARKMLTAMTTRPYESHDPYRPHDIYDSRDAALRELLCIPDESYADYASDMPDAIPQHEYDFMRDLLITIRFDKFSIQFLSMLALEQSLCPMHLIDYAACFDDDDSECATIRAFFPNHDT